MRRLLRGRFFWYAVILALFTGIFAYAPEIVTLSGIAPREIWELDYYVTLYRFLFLISVTIAAWRFGIKGGLATCSILGLIILPLFIEKVQQPNTWIDIGVFSAGILFSWLIGRQGEIQRLLEKSTEDLQNQAVNLNQEITERKRIEEKIIRATEEWRTTFDSITDLISIHDQDNKIVRVNKTFADTFNTLPEDLIGSYCYEVFRATKTPCQNCPHGQILKTQKPPMSECFESNRGRYFQISTSPMFNDVGKILGSVHVARDITERKQMEEHLIMTDRLASIGELASGIAHELNNPLTSIVGFSQLLMEENAPENMKKDLDIVNNEAKRACDIVKSLLTFARKHTSVKQACSLNKIIDEVLKLRAYEQSVNNIKIIPHLASDLSEISIDYFQIQQVFLNIIINAESAMLEANNHGVLTITTERIGNFISTSFADNGPGINEKIIDRIFDPFFTTKEVGKGTGLGLSICHGIVNEHNGKINVKSELGKGTTFIIELPVNGHCDYGENSIELELHSG